MRKNEYHKKLPVATLIFLIMSVCMNDRKLSGYRM